MEPVKKERKPFRWVSTIAYKEIEKIVTRGYNTTELVEKGYGLGDVIFVDYQSRIPFVRETKMLDYVMVVNLEDGLSPSAAMARIVAQSEAYMTQCCGAAVLAFGPAYGAFCELGNTLDRFLQIIEKEGISYAKAAKMLVEEYPTILENQGRTTLGVSTVDLKNPTPKRMFARAEKLGVAGNHIKLMKEVVKAVQESSDEPVDLDLLGSTTATMMDLGFTAEATWTIIAICRSYAAGAHAIDEIEHEKKGVWGQTLTAKELYNGPADRPVPDIAVRDKVAVSNKAMQGKTIESWYKDFTENKQTFPANGHAIVEEVPFLKDIKK